MRIISKTSKWQKKTETKWSTNKPEKSAQDFYQKSFDTHFTRMSNFSFVPLFQKFYFVLRKYLNVISDTRSRMHCFHQLSLLHLPEIPWRKKNKNQLVIIQLKPSQINRFKKSHSKYSTCLFRKDK